MNPTDEFEKLGEEEVRKHLINKDYGDLRNPNNISAQAWLRSKEIEREEVLNNENLSISRKALAASEEANSIAKESLSEANKANRISERSLFISKITIIVSIISAIIAAISAYIAFIKNP